MTRAVERTATTVGPAIAGVVVAVFGSIYALWVAAGLFGLASLVVATTLTNLLDQAFIAVLLPVWARSSGFGPEAVGLVVSVFGAASVVAALTAAALGSGSTAVRSISSAS